MSTRVDVVGPDRRQGLLRRMWVSLAGLVTSVGLAGAILFLHADVLLAAMVDGILVSVMFLGLRQAALTDTRRRRGATMTRYVAAVVANSTVGAVALAGLFRIIGPFALAVVASLGAIYVVLIRSSQVSEALRLSERLTPSDRNDVLSLTTAQLCTRWNDTLVEIQHTRSAGELSILADRRRAVLDELERRDPDAVGRWLEAHPRASSTPS